MKIKLLTSVASDKYSYTPGAVVELDDEFAQRLIKSGQAEAVAEPAKRVKRVKPERETR